MKGSMAVKGTFKDISFLELLQLMHLTRKTGRLEVITQNQWAMIIFNEGLVWHVEPRGYRGATSEDILFSMIADDGSAFTFQRVQVLPALERTVHISTESLILEGAKQLDEVRLVAEQSAETPPEQTNRINHILSLKPGAESKVRYVPQNVKKILQLIDGKRTVGDVVRDCQLDSAAAEQIIKDLLTQDILDASEPSVEVAV